MTTVERLTESLRAVGLSGDCAILRPEKVAEAGWVVLTAPRGQRVRVDGLKPGQAPTAQGVVDTFDFRNRQPRPQASLVADIQNLSPEDRNKLLVTMAATWLQEHPDMAKKLNLPFTGDEPL